MLFVVLALSLAFGAWGAPKNAGNSNKITCANQLEGRLLHVTDHEGNLASLFRVFVVCGGKKPSGAKVFGDDGKLMKVKVYKKGCITWLDEYGISGRLCLRGQRAFVSEKPIALTPNREVIQVR